MRIVNLDISTILEAATNDNLRTAIALALIIKSKITSSVYKDFSLRSLRDNLHIKYKTIQKAINYGYSIGLFTRIVRKGKDKKQHIDLKVNKIATANKRTVRFAICDSIAGKQIYFESKIQDNFKKHSKATKAQTISNIEDLILLAREVVAIKGYNKLYDSEKHRYLKSLHIKTPKCFKNSVAIHKFIKYLIATRSGKNQNNKLIMGYSIEAIRATFYDNISTYKVKQLTQMGIEEGLFTSESNACYAGDAPDKHMEYIHCDMPTYSYGDSLKSLFKNIEQEIKSANAAYKETFIERNSSGHIIRDDNKYLYRGKGRLSNCFLKRMANSYFHASDIFGGKHRIHIRYSKKKPSSNIDVIEKPLYVDIFSHINNNIPF